jgi:hypothetical protein
MWRGQRFFVGGDKKSEETRVRPSSSVPRSRLAPRKIDMLGLVDFAVNFG